MYLAIPKGRSEQIKQIPDISTQSAKGFATTSRRNMGEKNNNNNNIINSDNNKGLLKHLPAAIQPAGQERDRPGRLQEEHEELKEAALTREHTD